MKLLIGFKHVVFFFGLFISAHALAASELDGKTFCRMVPTGGLFGQPSGERQHCVAFENGFMTDNANTFFGNPPETIVYDLVNEINVVVKRGDTPTVEYQYKNEILVNKIGAVLTLK